MRLLAIAVRIHVAVAARNQDGIQASHQFLCVNLLGNQGQQHWGPTCLKQRLAVMLAQVEVILASIDATRNTDQRSLRQGSSRYAKTTWDSQFSTDLPTSIRSPSLQETTEHSTLAYNHALMQLLPSSALFEHHLPAGAIRQRE